MNLLSRLTDPSKQALNSQFKQLRKKTSLPNFSFYHYPKLNSAQRNTIKKLECKVFKLDEEKKIAEILEKNFQEALKQQEENKKFPLLTREVKQSWISSVIDWLFIGPPKIPFDRVDSSTLPEKLKVSSKNNEELSNSLAYSTGRRPTMEDAHFVKSIQVKIGKEVKNVSLSAVFDGHRGAECAAFASKELAKKVQEKLELYNPLELTDLGIYNALSLSFVDLSHSYNEKQIGKKVQLAAGTTANLSLEIDEQLWIANSGDSRAVLIQADGTAIQLSRDAKANDPHYRQRVQERFGDVFPPMVDSDPRVNGLLATACALGNHWANGAISARPDIIKLNRNDILGSSLIQACDGLWDVASVEEVAKRFQKLKHAGLSREEIAVDLVKTAYEADSLDNISVNIRYLK